MQVVEQLFDVERVALCARGDALDQRARHGAGAFGEQRAQLGAHQLFDGVGGQAGQLHHFGMRQGRQRRHVAFGRPFARQQQHRQRRHRARHPRQQFERQRVGSVQVFQHQQQAQAVFGRFGGSRLQAAQQHGFKQRFAVLGLQRGGEDVVGPVKPQHGTEQGPGVGVFARVQRQAVLHRLALAALGQRRVDVEERRPHRVPGAIGCVHAVAAAATPIADEATAQGQPDAFGNKPRFAHARFGHDAQHLALALARLREP